MPRLCAVVVLLLAVSLRGQTAADFSGRWRQQTNPGKTRQLEVEQKVENLRVKTAVTSSDGTWSFRGKQNTILRIISSLEAL
jgi:hypothetical protein